MILMTDTVVTRGSGAVGSLVPRVFCVQCLLYYSERLL